MVSRSCLDIMRRGTSFYPRVMSSLCGIALYIWLGRRYMCFILWIHRRANIIAIYIQALHDNPRFKHKRGAHLKRRRYTLCPGQELEIHEKDEEAGLRPDCISNYHHSFLHEVSVLPPIRYIPGNIFPHPRLFLRISFA
ncbi:hypothetical protein ASPVEDRAFT_247788 [Aspergillus versicolor CBS 583.65]|uniref:Uncharacterized protein n=1 Tax=Aspergillus versicolor CBS 583.65 TaxID=1036611 RepID=A0A1L9P538_ASPVE|nr:uncharacterized protein ASPVEDRAFT_247788 [Aspergillus versicolor CBS 583.65]OJI96647.1 hypothetical protein ASPVEDRAFT_247788 [Aspergillus versicolor CBS 583.65]